MVLITGVAGFIGFSVAKTLLELGFSVLGIDNLNEYYDVNLKLSRLNELKEYEDQGIFRFVKADIADRSLINEVKNLDCYYDIKSIIHLAAQAGVRYSIDNPHAYVDSNLVGHLNMLEIARHINGLEHFLYASSSSVYGSNTKLPFSVEDRVDTPISLYAATKKSCELMSHTYSHLYKIPATGLRFFTVYGPWGRPDMAAFIFTKAIIKGEKIQVFNNGKMRRNFTYIDDIVSGVIACLKSPPKTKESAPPHKVYNIGNNRSEDLMDFISTLESHIGKKAIIDFQPMQMGDVKETVADIDDTIGDLGFLPKTNIDEGLKNFVLWYKKYYVVDVKDITNQVNAIG